MKVDFLNRDLWKEFLTRMSIISAILSIIFIFFSIPNDYKGWAGLIVILLFLGLYLWMWYGANHLTEINLSIDGSKVSVLVGDLFEQSGSKVIAFNEYFDTQVDDIIITKNSLNGIYINKYFGRSVAELDQIIDNNHFLDGELIEKNVKRLGKSKKYKLGTICKLDDYLLVAFSKFDSKNRAVLTMPEYLEFLINFWDSINRVYARKSVSVPIFGSGITRIKEHKNISDEELLKIMLWTFRISEMRFKHPAKLNIVIHHDKIDSINLQSIKSMGNGF
ncbi:macro domain-containing protein [Providencia rettgeri]|uniref:macro domain-containing protein n=1 Tax=Providencia sp. PROV019 TaxID=2949754 RepID=UPI00234B785A